MIAAATSSGTAIPSMVRRISALSVRIDSRSSGSQARQPIEPIVDRRRFRHDPPERVRRHAEAGRHADAVDPRQLPQVRALAADDARPASGRSRRDPARSVGLDGSHPLPPTSPGWSVDAEHSQHNRGPCGKTPPLSYVEGGGRPNVRHVGSGRAGRPRDLPVALRRRRGRDRSCPAGSCARRHAECPRVQWDTTNAVCRSSTPTRRWQDGICHIATSSRHANLGFNDGAALPDPLRLLEGSGARMRHVSFRSVDEVSAAPWVDDYLHAAPANAGVTAESVTVEPPCGSRPGRSDDRSRRRSCDAVRVLGGRSRPAQQRRGPPARRSTHVGDDDPFLRAGRRPDQLVATRDAIVLDRPTLRLDGPRSGGRRMGSLRPWSDRPSSSVGSEGGEQSSCPYAQPRRSRHQS